MLSNNIFYFKSFSLLLSPHVVIVVDYAALMKLQCHSCIFGGPVCVNRTKDTDKAVSRWDLAVSRCVHGCTEMRTQLYPQHHSPRIPQPPQNCIQLTNSSQLSSISRITGHFLTTPGQPCWLVYIAHRSTRYSGYI